MKYYNIRESEIYKSGDISINPSFMYLITKSGRLVVANKKLLFWNAQSYRATYLCEVVERCRGEPVYRKIEGWVGDE